MTFEARDSAAKVVPARFKPSMNSSVQVSSTKSTPHTLRSLQRLDSKINNSCQTPVSKGSYRLGSGDRSPISDPHCRRMLTSAFVQFSRALMEDSPRRRTSEANLNKSPSAPNLSGIPDHIPVNHRPNNEEFRKANRRGSPKITSRLYQEPMRTSDRCTLLSPQLLQRQALSVDNPFYEAYGCCSPPPPPDLCRQCSGKSGSHDSLHMELGASAGVSGSQASMALDLHDCQVTLKVKDESQNRRSEVSRRHQLLRQRPVEDEKDPLMRCPCITHDDSVIRRAEVPCPVFRKSLQTSGHSSPKTSNFYRSRSCTDDRPHERKIYCIEDHKRRKYPSAEKLRSPRRTCPGHVHGHGQALVRKNAKRRRSSQRTDGSPSYEEPRSGISRSPTVASPVRNSSTSLNRTEAQDETVNDPS